MPGAPGKGRGRAIRALGTVIAAILPVASALAADADGEFAIKGAGSQTCTAFTAAWDGGTADLALYAGWVDGYLTGVNQFTAETYDMAGWQTPETLLGLTRQICGAVPGETRFMDAFYQVQRLIAPTRLTAASPLVALTHQGQSLLAYEAVVRRMQDRLAALGYPTGTADGRFDPETAAAIVAFQTARGLPATGLPDQKTLFELFREN